MTCTIKNVELLTWKLIRWQLKDGSASKPRGMVHTAIMII